MLLAVLTGDLDRVLRRYGVVHAQECYEDHRQAGSEDSKLGGSKVQERPSLLLPSTFNLITFEPFLGKRSRKKERHAHRVDCQK